jgi:2,4-dienoyl-CoA reductase (NADPH2)
MGTNLGAEDGYVTEHMKRYYEERAKGGVGLVIVEVASVGYPKGAAMVGQLGISDDRFIPGLAVLAEVIHRHGAKVAIQLQHAGKLATTDLKQGRVPVSASEVSIPLDAVLKDLSLTEIMKIASGFTEIPEGGPRARELTLEEIGEVVGYFAEAADRAKRAGFDGVEVHAAHGYLIAQFLSRSTNKRRDGYGGAQENRAKILVEILQAIRGRVGAHYPVWCRLDSREFRIEEGITPEEAQQTAMMAEASGADALHVSAYGGASGIGPTEGPFVHDAGSLLPYAEAIKRVVEIPVIAVGRITPTLADKAVASGQADFVAMGRQLLADPELPAKLAEERPEDIRPCINCYTCGSQIYVNEPVTCSVNPAVGKEADFDHEPAAKARRVLVVGGGPAGMQTAILAAERGHHVTLCDKERRLGGTVVISALPWEANQDLVDYMKGQIEKLRVDVRLKQAVDIGFIKELSPDVVVVAVGPKRGLPRIPGIEGNNVLTGDDFRQIFTGYLNPAVSKKLSMGQRLMIYTKWVFPVGGERVVVLGGELAGCELADFLSERGREVTVLEQGDTLAADMSIVRRARVLHGLRDRGVSLHTGVTAEEITDEEVIFTDKEGIKHRAEADTVFVASGIEPNMDLYNAIQGDSIESRLAGDCAELRLIQGAIADGLSVGRAI